MDAKGLTCFIVLFFIELSTRRVEVGGIARNLTDGVDGFFKGKRYLIHDRDPSYTQQFLSMLGEVGIEFKEGCLDQMIFFDAPFVAEGAREKLWHVNSFEYFDWAVPTPPG